MLDEPKFRKLPTKEDFYYDGGDDERHAIDTFLGKDVDYVLKKLYSSIPLTVLEDFYFVGTKAFRYYIFAAFRYLQKAIENEKLQDIDMQIEVPVTLSLTLDLLLKHIRENPKEMSYIADYVEHFSRWVIANYDKFDTDEEIFGDLKKGWKQLEHLAKKVKQFKYKENR